jgi:hypothetical protein
MAAPRFPLAPGRLSITTGWPQSAVNRSPTVRARRSLAAPGACGTMSVIVRDGNSCAAAIAGAATTPSASVQRNNVRTSEVMAASPSAALLHFMGRVPSHYGIRRQ